MTRGERVVAAAAVLVCDWGDLPRRAAALRVLAAVQEAGGVVPSDASYALWRVCDRLCDAALLPRPARARHEAEAVALMRGALADFHADALRRAKGGGV